MPTSLETLERYAFYATAISEVSLPENLQKIDAFAFGCTRFLSDIIISENTDINKKAFESENGTVFVQSVYCSGENASCLELQRRESMEGKVKVYTQDGNNYFYNNKWYENLNDIIGDKHIQKRIYTIDEASKVTGQINTLKIRYK